MTLVEMIVSFALLGLFMVAATTVISSVTNLYYQAKTISYGQEVSELVFKKLRSELEEATGNVVISTDGSSITFTNGNESKASFTLQTKDGSNYLVEKFEKVDSIYDKRGNVLEEGFEAVDWTMGEATYMGYTIDKLSFHKADSSIYPGNVIYAELEISNPRYGKYTNTEYIRLYKMPETSLAIQVKDNP